MSNASPFNISFNLDLSKKTEEKTEVNNTGRATHVGGSIINSGSGVQNVYLGDSFGSKKKDNQTQQQLTSLRGGSNVIPDDSRSINQ